MQCCVFVQSITTHNISDRITTHSITKGQLLFCMACSVEVALCGCMACSVAVPLYGCKACSVAVLLCGCMAFSVAVPLCCCMACSITVSLCGCKACSVAVLACFEALHVHHHSRELSPLPVLCHLSHCPPHLSLLLPNRANDNSSLLCHLSNCPVLCHLSHYHDLC